ncbi:MAG: Ppx/GppA family phosphatase [Candidatus Omnitrophica bacterium]|nr:Ppx/GppA family phosphatase [Candidatus Omnitrophota bacterium]MCA9414890.1 Ppx/GppA family phosphatase [Candidatus Omnitrophota bacterium]MCA9424611.1 Ppx/GppA family phosphatase [Candidatus Omnitrophota bacterium]MCA9446305.1 Ppx/GppA family phosphatase [Candidatus Omnitrophota bacterium]MCB9769735.1 Ppx/GppA family phosphatase [Candidatus Omnitrophota bacterium]
MTTVTLKSTSQPNIPMRLGVIDIGANSVHLLVVQIWEDFTYTTVYDERAQVRMGRSVFESGEIDPPTQSRALAALRKFSISCRKENVDVTLLVATSAVREASNSAEFIDRVFEETGFKVDVIPGREEARLTAIAATHSLGMLSGRVLVMDVGGGTSEFAWMEDDEPKELLSLHLGPVRLLDAIPSDGPPGSAGIDEIRRICRKGLGPVFRVKEMVPDLVLATSGTALCLGELCGTKRRSPTGLETSVVVRPSLSNLLHRLAEMDLEKRREWLKEHRDRADTLLPGGMIFLTAMEELGLDKLIVGGKALRDGIILNYMEHVFHTSPRDRSERLIKSAITGTVPSERNAVREQSILKMARIYNYDRDHSHTVLHLATRLFEQLRPYQWMGDEDLFYLQSAALLHDIGYYISAHNHHHHSQYLVLHSDLEGFHLMERRIIANIVRYHSRENPSDQHAEFGTLSEDIRNKVRLLSGILRVADALDFTHSGYVEDVEIESEGDRMILHLRTKGEIDLEIQELRAKGGLFSEVYDRELDIRIQQIESDESVEEKLLDRKGSAA